MGELGEAITGRRRGCIVPPAIAVLAVKVEPLGASLTRTLTAERGAGVCATMIVAERTGLSAGFVQQRSWMDRAASERRGCRTAGEA